MKFQKDQILYFKPSYKLKTKECWICQIVKYIENSNRYLVILQDIYAPFHYLRSYVLEDDLGDINETFVLNEMQLDELKLHFTLKEVYKLHDVDLYNK